MSKKFKKLIIMVITITIILGQTLTPVKVKAETEDISNKINKAQEWLASMQKEDGSFEGRNSYNTTCTVLSALRNTSYDETKTRGKDWVMNQSYKKNIDSCVRAITLNPSDSDIIEYVLECQNKDGGFGLNSNYSSDALDSLLVLECFTELDVESYKEQMLSLISYLLSVQNTDGGWSYLGEMDSDRILTARIGLAVNRYMEKAYLKSEMMDTAIIKTNNFLNLNNSYNFDEDKIIEDCYVYAYFSQQELLFNDNENIQTLLNKQNDNGSFYNDIEKTAIVVNTLNKVVSKEPITTKIYELETALNLNSVLVDNNATVCASSKINYYTNIDKDCVLKLFVMDGENILYEETKNIQLSKNASELEIETGTFEIKESEPKTINIITRLIDGDNVIAQNSINFEVKERLQKTDVLLIESTLPWSSNANSIVLNQLDISFKKISAAEATNVDFLDYRLVIVANDQTNSTYRILGALRTEIESFVRNGGTLLYGVCDSGWGGSGTSDAVIPGDIQIAPVNYQYNNYIVDNNHPIVTAELSDKKPLTNGDLYHNYTSHRNFIRSSLPEGTNIILNGGNDEIPTLVEYKIGKGMVIASGLTWEHNYSNKNGSFGKKAMDDLFLYAYSITYDNIDEEDPGTVISTIETDKSAYLPSEQMNIIINSTLSSFRRNAKAIVEITDENDNSIAIVKNDINELITVGINTLNEAEWRVGSLISGKYIVKVTWWDEEEKIGEAKSEFIILADKNLLNTVNTDKKEYKLQENISINNFIQNRSTNGIEKNFEIILSIFDNNSNKVLEYQNICKELLPGGNENYNHIIEAGKLINGKYIIICEIKKDGEAISSQETEFTILEETHDSVDLKGTLYVSKTDEGNQKLLSSITNNGTNDIEELLIRISVFDSETSLIKIFEHKLNLAAKETIELEDIFNTYELKNGNYIVLLDGVTKEGKVIPLDISGFVYNLDYRNFDKVLCSLGDKPLKLETSIADIDGKSHSNNDFIFRGSVLKANGSISTVGNVFTEGIDISVANKTENADRIIIPDYRKVLIEKNSNITEIFNNYSNNGDMVLEHPILSQDTVYIEGSKISVNNDIISTNNIQIYGDRLEISGEDKIIICSLEGDIILNSGLITANSFIYAPNGSVYINGSDLQFTGNIIAKEIVLKGSNMKLK